MKPACSVPNDRVYWRNREICYTPTTRSPSTRGLPGLGHVGREESAIPVKQLEADLIAVRDALVESDARFQTLADALPHMVWSTLPDGFHDYFNARWYDFTGVPHGTTDGDGWNDMFHPDDRERAWKAWRDSLASGRPYEIEYRLRHRTGEYRWTLGRALPVRGPDDEILRWIGTCTDIHEAKKQAEQVEILSRELSHRIKNIFAVVGALIGLSARGDPTQKEFARLVQERIGALARAHEFVRPEDDGSSTAGAPVSLRALLERLLAPYPAYADGRIRIKGVDAKVGDRCVTPVALLVHELATNAAKYGSLSTAEGQVALDVRLEGGSLALIWHEIGGPKIAGPPETTGFGTELAEVSVRQHLGGTIEREWLADGLKVCARFPIGSLAPA